MPWLYLFIAGLLEVVWAAALKSTEGFTRLWPSMLFLGALGGSMVLLGLAARTLPIGTAYGVWVGIGAVGAALVGIFMFGEPASAARLFFIVLLIASIVGLKLTSPG